MMDADHGGLRHRRMAHGGILDRGTRDPFATRLDHVLGAIDDLDGAVRKQPGDVAGLQPAFGDRRFLLR
jgi:hypothetical protein